MNRSLSALFAAIDAFIGVAIGVGIPLLVTTLLWAFQFGLVVDWAVFWRAAADVWLLGNGVDLQVQLDPALAASLGLPGAGEPFALTIALCGFALLTVMLGRRSGIRLSSSSEAPITGVVVGVLVVSGLSGLVALSAGVDGAGPSLWQALLIVPLVYLCGMAIGVLLPGRAGGGLMRRGAGLVREALNRLRIPVRVRPVLLSGVRAGTMAASAIVAVSAATVALLLMLSFPGIVSLYEGTQAGVLGGLTITVVQLALLPNLVGWTAAWFVGPGFALGAGTAVSPLGTNLALVPALPVLGALPHDSGIGLVGLLVPVGAGFLVGALLRPRWRECVSTRVSDALIAAAVGALLAGAILGAIAAWSAGAVGPGRLADVGPNPWMVALLAVPEVFVGIAAGLLAPLVRRESAGRASVLPGRMGGAARDTP